MVLASFLLLSCSLSPEQEAVSRAFTLPDLSLSDATYVMDRGEEPPLTVVADEIAIYETSHMARIKGLHFSQKDTDGNLALRGQAETAVVDTESYDVELSGSVFVEKFPENLRIEAEALQWLGEEETLISEGDTLVTLVYEGDKRVQGTGMKTTLATFTVTFDSVLNGVIYQ